MKVLITGGAGFIGSHIVDMLIEEGDDVVIVDNLSSGNENNLNRKAKFYKMDIQDPKLELIFKDEKPDYVSHHAAQIDVRLSVSDPIHDAKINVLGALNVFQNSLNHNVKKVVFASSGGAIYGEQEIFPAPESHPLRPISPYGITKLVAEQYLFYYKTVFNLDYVALRYANVYGPRQDPFGEAGVVSIFIQKMLKGEQPIINGDGGQTRDFVYVKDVARANLFAIKNNISENIINIGTGIETSVNEIFHYIRKAINPSIEEKHGPSNKGEQRRSIIDRSRAKQVLCWEPVYMLEDGLKSTCDYFETQLSIS